ncbi:MAG TPA: CRTAC1 family protein [Thermoanaerobaculia bacterium]|nr:CRTAC1 family protein [Thermoanaerobaculia bacterium]
MPAPRSIVVAPLAATALALALLAFAPGPAVAGELYEDVTEEVGLDFLHFNGMSGRLYYLEVVGSGGALLDYDRDGDLDLYLVQGGMLGGDLDASEATFPWAGSEPPRDRLYRNDLEIRPDGSRRLRFVDVTKESGIRAEEYGMGAAVGDVDNDGWPDLYVLNYGRNQLWRNRGDGTFEEQARERGVDDDRWSVSATFADLDGDGWLDLFVAEYLDYTLLGHKTCLTERGEPDYCQPSAFRPIPDRVYRNRGDGTFEEVSERWGIARTPGNGLGVVSADFDGDGRLDVYVANDLMPNHLWLNRGLGAGGGGLIEDGLLAGVAVNADGKAEASMGIGCGDFDADGDLDLFLTHFHREHNTLYVAEGDLWQDATERFGLAAPSYPYTAFGTGFLDFDLDGWLDLVAVNGRVTHRPGVDRAARPFGLDEPNQLFRNLEGKAFEDVSERAGEGFARSEVSRAALIGDLDNDGDPDLVVTNNSGPARVLLDRAPESSAGVGSAGEDTEPRGWIGLRVLDGERDAYNALVTMAREGGPLLMRRVQSDGGYASANDPRVLFGLGAESGGTRSVRVRWPAGGEERFDDLPVGRYSTIRRGRGVTVGGASRKCGGAP